MNLRKKRLTFAALLALSLAMIPACGGGGGGGDSDETSEGDQRPAAILNGTIGSYEASEVESVLNARFGEDTALGAVISAVDKGYTPEQISQAAMENTLTSAGDITNKSPEDTPINRVVARMLAAKAEPIQADRSLIAQRAREYGASIGETGMFLILALINSGFPPEAVIDTLISGQIFVDPEEGTLLGQPHTFYNMRLVMSDGTVYRRLWDNSEDEFYITREEPSTNPSPTPTPSINCSNGTFTCANGTLICAENVCNQTDNCGDGSDESASLCGNQESCCVATRGCPGETGSLCGQGCCCCPYAQACNQSDWRAGCMGAATRYIVDDDLGKLLRSGIGR